VFLLTSECEGAKASNFVQNMQVYGNLDKNMDERRHFPRYACDLELQIQSPNGRGHPVRSNDISAAGISLRIPQSVISELASEGASLDIGNTFVLLLPTTGKHVGEKPGIECRVMHVRRLSQDYYLIGAWFNSALAADLLEKCTLLVNARHDMEY